MTYLMPRVTLGETEYFTNVRQVLLLLDEFRMSYPYVSFETNKFDQNFDTEKYNAGCFNERH